MHDKVEAAELLIDPCEDRIDVRVRRDIAGQHKWRLVKPLRQIVDMIFETPLIRDRKAGSTAGCFLRDRPRNRPLVGHADDQAMLTGEIRQRLTPALAAAATARTLARTLARPVPAWASRIASAS